jgi:hypothetical protein
MSIGEGMSSKTFTIMMVVGGLLTVGAIHSSYLEIIQNRKKQLEQAWQEQGCQMYDNANIDSVPAKCLNYFTDHYEPQEQRVQPPEL